MEDAEVAYRTIVALGNMVSELDSRTTAHSRSADLPSTAALCSSNFWLSSGGRRRSGEGTSSGLGGQTWRESTEGDDGGSAVNIENRLPFMLSRPSASYQSALTWPRFPGDLAGIHQ